MSDIDYKAKYFQLVRKVTIQNTYVLQIENENKELKKKLEHEFKIIEQIDEV